MSASQSRVPPPREPLLDQNGAINRSWWRWFNDVFIITGSGQATQNLVQVIENVTSNTTNIGDTSDITYATPSSAGRVAELERRVANLESLLMSAPAVKNIADLEGRLKMLEAAAASPAPKPDLAPLRRDLDLLAAYTLGTH